MDIDKEKEIWRKKRGVRRCVKKKKKNKVTIERSRFLLKRNKKE